MNTLAPNTALGPDERLTSPNGRYALVMQGDGNLVLYRDPGGVPLWSSGSDDAGARLVMQGDGNAVIYLGTTPCWASDTCGHDGGSLVLRDDGALLVTGDMRIVNPDPTPNPEPVDPTPHLRLYMAGMTYSWPIAMIDGTMADELDALVTLRREAGLPAGAVGLSVELAASAYWVALPDWKQDLAAQVDLFIVLVPMLRARQIPIAMYFWNTNSPGKAIAASWDKQDHAGNLAYLISQAQRVKSAVGFEGMIINAANEDDASTHVSIRTGLRQWFASNCDPAQLMAPEPLICGERYIDTHPAHVSGDEPCGPRNVVTSDNGPIMAELYGSVEGQIVNMDMHAVWIEPRANRGQISLYNLCHQMHIRSQSYAWSHVLADYARARAVVPPVMGDDLDLASVGAIIVKNCHFSQTDLRDARCESIIEAAHTDGTSLWTTYGPYDWPTETGENDTTVDAICYLFYDSLGSPKGGKFDFWRVGGQAKKSLINVVGGYGGHRMPARGTPCWTMISSLDGARRSNTRRVTWE